MCDKFWRVVKTQIAGLTPRVSDLINLESDLVICISREFLGDAAAILGIMLWKILVYSHHKVFEF